MRVRSWSLLAECTLLSCVLIQTAVRGEEDNLHDISDDEIRHSSTRRSKENSMYSNANNADMATEYRTEYCDGEDDPMCSASLQHEGFDFAHTDSETDYNKIGIRYAGEGDLGTARDYFRAAALHTPNRGDIWANIALTIHDQCKPFLFDGSNQPKVTKCKSLMREALAALQVGIILGNRNAPSMRASAMETFKTYFPSACEADAKHCAQYRVEEEALQMAERGEIVNAANNLCKKENLVVHFGSWEMKKGIVYGQTYRRILILLRVCGVVHLRSVFDVDVLKPIADAHEGNFQAWVEKAAEKNPSFASSNVEWANVASRGSHRFETRLPMKPPFIDPRFVGNRFLLTVIKGVLGAKIELDTFSAVTSMPGSPDQSWHGDVATLFGTIKDKSTHSPAHGLVAIVPFVDLTPTTGATEYYMGSHTEWDRSGVGDTDFWVDQDDQPPTPQMELYAEAGDVVLFDMRLRHRGKGNNSPNNRPIGYLGYVNDWYSDKVNFKEKQTRAFDTLPLKKLFARQDQKQYLANLERLVEESYGKEKLEELQTEGKWKAVNMFA